MIQQGNTSPNTFTSYFTNKNISYARITKDTPAQQANPNNSQLSTHLNLDLTSAITNSQLFVNQFFALSEQLSKAFLLSCNLITINVNEYSQKNTKPSHHRNMECKTNKDKRDVYDFLIEQ